MLFTYKLIKNKNITDDIRIMQFAPKNKAISFIAGQYTEVLLEKNNTLPFSIANLPNEEGIIELHIRHRTIDSHITKLLENINQTKTISITEGKGKNTISSTALLNSNNLLFIAGGTGYSQIGVLLEDLIEKTKYSNEIENNLKNIQIKFYWGVKKIEDLYLKDRLKNILKKLPDLTFIPVISNKLDEESENRINKTYPNYKTGLVINVVSENELDLTNTIVFNSGPYPMVQDALIKLKDNQLSLENFHCDMA